MVRKLCRLCRVLVLIKSLAHSVVLHPFLTFVTFLIFHSSYFSCLFLAFLISHLSHCVPLSHFSYSSSFTSRILETPKPVDHLTLSLFLSLGLSAPFGTAYGDGERLDKRSSYFTYCTAPCSTSPTLKTLCGISHPANLINKSFHCIPTAPLIALISLTPNSPHHQSPSNLLQNEK